MSTGFHRTQRFLPIGAVDLEVAKPSNGVGATNCNETYFRNLGLMPLSADLSVTSASQVSKHFHFSASDVDVLISCAPCTGFSQKNSKNHILDDARNNLVERTIHFVEQWRPKYFVMENVKELIKGKHSHHFQSLHKKLLSMGYYVNYEIHNLSDYGLPQNRIRSLIIAKLGAPITIAIPKVKKKSTVRETIGHLPKLARGGQDANDPMHICTNLSDRLIERLRAIPKNGGSWIDIPPDKRHLLIPSMNTEKPGSFPDIYGRLCWDDVAPTITRECAHPGNGRYSHPDQDRLLSVREMALLQGFPADYFFTGNLSSKYRQIGDAVPPLIAQKIAEQILADVDGKTINTTQEQLRLPSI